MKAFRLIFLLLCFAAYPAVTQEPAPPERSPEVRGRLVDADTDQPIPDALIVLSYETQSTAAADPNSYLVARQYALSDSTGAFVLPSMVPKTRAEGRTPDSENRLYVENVIQRDYWVPQRLYIRAAGPFIIRATKRPCPEGIFAGIFRVYLAGPDRLALRPADYPKLRELVDYWWSRITTYVVVDKEQLQPVYERTIKGISE